MSDEQMGDDVYQPENEEQADAAPLDLEDALNERDYDQTLDEGYSPPERPLGAEKTGITASEQREGESLEERLRQEVPDVGQDEPEEIGDLPGGTGEPIDPEAGDARSGRLVSPDEELTASDVGIDAGAASAEEAAVHVVPDEEGEG